MSSKKKRKKKKFYAETTLDVTVADDEKVKSAKIAKVKKPAGGTGKAVSAAVEQVVDQFVESVLAKGVEGIRAEFAGLKTFIPADYKFTAFTENPTRNRYKDVVCLDSTRIVLTLNVPPESNYVHANWVKMENVDQVFIASQAPLETTIGDFWRLCYQENVATIIMLCKVDEDGKQKSAQYWPLEAGTYKTYGSMFINNKKVDNEDKFLVYTLEVLPEGCSNSIILKLVHMMDWPDRGVPNSGLTVLRLLRLIEKTGPCIVHCSAGIGRTGTVIGIETVIQRLWKTIPVQLPEVLKEMRNQRASCIQTEAQYVFVVSTVLDYIKAKIPSKYREKVLQFHVDIKKAAMV